MQAGRMRSPDLAEVHAFVVAARTGSLSRAAVELRVSTPAVAKRVRNLEALAGTSLLERSNRGVRLTSAGRAIFEDAARLVEAAGSLFTVLDQADDPETSISGLQVLLQRAAAPPPATESILAEAEQILARLFHATRDPIAVSRLADGTIFEANDAFCSFVGYSREQVLGRTSVGLQLWADPDDRPRAIAHVTEGGRAPFPVQMRDAAGRVVSVEMSGSIIRLGGENRLLTTLRDQSGDALEQTLARRVRQLSLMADLAVEAAESQASAELLHRSVALLEGALAAEAVAVFELDRGAGELRLAAAAGSLAGREDELRLGAAGPDASMLAALFEPAAVGHIGLGRPLTSVIEGRSGSYGILAVYGRAGCVAPDEHAVFLDVVASVLGVAVRRMEAEAALGDREVTLTAFFDAAADPMLIADGDRRYVDANAAALDVLGYTREELLALRIEDLRPPPIVDDMDVRWQAFLAQGTVRGSGEVRRKDGSPLAVEYHSRARFMPGSHLTVLRLLPPPR